jgi:hypothetical protein
MIDVILKTRKDTERIQREQWKKGFYIIVCSMWFNTILGNFQDMIFSFSTTKPCFFARGEQVNDTDTKNGDDPFQNGFSLTSKDLIVIVSYELPNTRELSFRRY